MENADGVVGRWSNELRVTVPVPANHTSSNNSNSNSNHNNININNINTDAATCYGYRHQNRRSKDKDKRTKQNIASGFSTPRHTRFDLLVPALIETFACLVDNGDNLIAKTSASTARPSFPHALLAPEDTTAVPTEIIVETAKNVEHHKDASGERNTVVGKARQTHKTSVSSASRSATRDSPTATLEEGTPTDVEHVQKTTVYGEAGSGEGETPEEGGGSMVWEQHWDTRRGAPFYRLRGQDLSLWQVPVL